jgi:hypothetical protein
MECGEIWLYQMVERVRALFRCVTTEDAAVGLVQTIQCELNGEPALGLLLQLQRDTLRGYDITETGFTLDTVLTDKQLPGDLGWRLLREAEARRAAGAPPERIAGVGRHLHVCMSAGVQRGIREARHRVRGTATTRCPTSHG